MRDGDGGGIDGNGDVATARRGRGLAGEAATPNIALRRSFPPRTEARATPRHAGAGAVGVGAVVGADVAVGAVTVAGVGVVGGGCAGAGVGGDAGAAAGLTSVGAVAVVGALALATALASLLLLLLCW